MPIGSPVHDRTFPLCESLNYRDWSGYYAVERVRAASRSRIRAIRNASALIDISPSSSTSSPGVTRPRLVDRVDHARRLEDDCRTGVLHAVVRRARPA